MTTRRLTRIDPVKTAGVASLLAIIGSILWLPAALIWRSRFFGSGAYTQMVEQFGTVHGGMAEFPVWLLLISPFTTGGLVLLSTFVTVAITNMILKRIGGIPLGYADTE